MIGYTEALEIISKAISPLPPRKLPLGAALGTVTPARIDSLMDVPNFDNAAMDGFALVAQDIQDASANHPAELEIATSLVAGDAVGTRLPAGQAIEIMTGAPLPQDCDVVVPVERTRRGADSSRVQFLAPARQGENIRRAGEDFRRGTEIVAAHSSLTPERLMACAAAGYDHLSVRPRPRLAVVTTGAEVVNRGAKLASGYIRDANGPYLRAAVPRCGAELISLTTAGDEAETIAERVAAAASDADLVVTTGGVSAGRFDAVPAALERLDASIHFHKVLIRPGKPILLAQLPDKTWVFGLPGNPMAVAVGLRFFVVPGIRALQDFPPECFSVANTVNIARKRAGPRFFAKAHARIGKTGQLEVEILKGQESFRILPLTRANCWAIISEGVDDAPAGTRVSVASLYPDAWPNSAAD